MNDHDMPDEKDIDILSHIKSLGGYATENQIGSPKRISNLVNLGYISQIWINTYELTELGESAAKQ